MALGPRPDGTADNDPDRQHNIEIIAGATPAIATGVMLDTFIVLQHDGMTGAAIGT